MRAALLALAAVALAGTADARPIAKGARYVAMGSSYAAGTGINGIKPGTPQRCGRSASNYATLLAGKLGLALDDQTCGGATTAHILGPWSELSPQIDAVNADTRLVTLTIGGNDLGYVMNLFAGSCTGGTFAVQGVQRPCPALKPPSAEDYARLEGNLRKIASEVHSRAPKARLVFVQYVKLIPQTPCPALGLSPEGAMITRHLGERLALVTARAATSEGAEVLQTQDLSTDHTLCDAQPWSAGPKPLGPQANTPWHPNTTAHAAIAAELEKMLRR